MYKYDFLFPAQNLLFLYNQGGVRMPNPSQVPQMANYNSPSSQQGPQSNQGPQPTNMGMRGQPPQGPPSQMGPQMTGPNASLSPMPPMNMSQNQVRWQGPQQSSGPTQVWSRV